MTNIKTEVFMETIETYTIKLNRFSIRNKCEICNCEVSMISPSEAAFLICQDLNIINSMIEKNQIHLSYFNTETPLICLRSLSLI